MPKVPSPEILDDDDDNRDDRLSKKPVPMRDLAQVLKCIKGQEVQVWKDTGGRRAPVPGPSDGGMWPVEMVRDGICDLPPVSIIKDPATGTYFKVNLSVEAATVGQPANGYGQGYGQVVPQGDISSVVKDLAGLIMESDRDLRRANADKDKMITDLREEITRLKLELEQSNAQPEGVFETLVNNMSKTESGQAMIGGTISEVLEKLSAKSKKR